MPPLFPASRPSVLATTRRVKVSAMRSRNSGWAAISALNSGAPSRSVSVATAAVIEAERGRSESSAISPT